MSHQMSSSANPTDWTSHKGRQRALDNLALTTMAIPGVGDATGLTADIHSLGNPNNRTLGNISLMALGAVSPAPSFRAIKKLFKNPEDVANFTPEEANKILEGRKTAVYDEQNDQLYLAKGRASHNASGVDMVNARAKLQGIDPHAVGFDEQMKMMFDNATYGIEHEGKVFSREAQAALEEIRSGFDPFHGFGGESIQQDAWSGWRARNAEKLKDPMVKKFLKQFTKQNISPEGLKGMAEGMARVFGPDETTTFISRFRPVSPHNANLINHIADMYEQGERVLK
jgi:hypothetical protein